MTPMTRANPVIALTPGEPAGIGPDLCVLLAQQPRKYDLVLIADPDLLQQRAQTLGKSIELVTWRHGRIDHTGVSIAPVTTARPAVPGRLDTANAPYVIETLERAVQGCLTGEFDALVTGPVHKGIINDAGIAFTGHTELLAQRSQTQQVVMMLTAGTLRVALATTHVPLSEVSGHLSHEHLTGIIRILHRELRDKFRIAQPDIAVCGLNPHAGEGGHLGREEIEVIAPVIKELIDAEGMRLRGPLPADTVFTPGVLQDTDAVLAMYHDQGLPVLKYAGFGEAINITLGLPFIRTSVDHGTALDLAGTGDINTGSLHNAIELALSLRRP